MFVRENVTRERLRKRLFVGVMSRGKKPMPLNLLPMDEPPRMRGNSNPNAQQQPNPVHNPMPMPTGTFLEAKTPLRIENERRIFPEELLDLMSIIALAVRRNEFNATLATQVYRLYQQLKMCGDVMEANYPSKIAIQIACVCSLKAFIADEMNACFVALRQACCRDSGALGSPCRLKIMELIELRAMGWRPNFSHSQYYVQRQQHGIHTSSAAQLAATVAMQRGWLPPLGRKKESGNYLCSYPNRSTPNPTARIFPLQKCTESLFFQPHYHSTFSPTLNQSTASMHSMRLV